MPTCEVTLKNGKIVIVEGRVELFDETNPKFLSSIKSDKEDTIHLFNSREVVSVSESVECTNIITVGNLSDKQVKKALDGIKRSTPRLKFF